MVVVALDAYGSARHEPQGLELGKEVGIDLQWFADAPEHEVALALAEPCHCGGRREHPGCKADVFVLTKFGKAGNRVSVWRKVWPINEPENLAFDLLAHHVLPATSLLVHELPLEADDVGQQALGEAMLAHHANGKDAAVLGQL